MVNKSPRRRPDPPPSARPPATKKDRDEAQEAIAKLRSVGKLVTKALLALGGGALVFTCVNVTRFATTHDIPWYIAWMLDPLASLALITVLYVDGVLAEQGDYKPNGFPFLLRWTAGLSTWVMNCWTSLYPDGTFHLIPQHPDAGGILLHSIAPVLLILLSEAASGYRKYVAKRLDHYGGVIDAFAAREEAERQRKAQETRDEAERQREEENARKREERAEVERKAKIEEEHAQREHAAKLERERIAAQNEALRIKSQAEIEKARETDRIERERAEREAAKAAREAKIEADRLRTEAEIEEQARDREAQRRAEIIKAEGEAKARQETAEAEARALETKAQAEARAHEEAERIKRQQAQERAQKREQARQGASEGSRRRASISSGHTSESASKNGGTLLAIPAPSASESASEIGGRVPRDVRERQRDEAERYVAKCLLNNETPDLEALANRYGKGETWVGDRVRTANKRLADEPGFEDSVIEEAITLLDSAASSAA
ncbi:hypothetical protein M8I34_32330 [Streptomyces sp. MCA2]|uniref:hypothetical protein n=1 Tax=Streptomyces sp. MCA2 TaxID=2944805 RepID=UPI0020219333|nr:hypothetical protein [Streptomyces sp. MCA2]MCL7496057.1 hypothetical protein [Streptomyces sp. MCA2]